MEHNITVNKIKSEIYSDRETFLHKILKFEEENKQQLEKEKLENKLLMEKAE